MLKKGSGFNSAGNSLKANIIPAAKGHRVLSVSQLWRSRISWKITLSVFLTLLVVQTCILIVTVPNFEKKYLQDIRENGRVSFSAAVDAKVTSLSLKMPIDKRTSRNLVVNTKIAGFTVYSLDNDLLGSYGEAPLMQLNKSTFNNKSEVLSHDKKHYEIIYSSLELGYPFIIVAHLNSSDLQNTTLAYVKENLLIFFLLSGFVTSVLLIVLGQWLLEPIILLRNNLIEAAKHPEEPNITYPKRNNNDEVGVALKIANDLIKQNSMNLLQLRSQAEDRIHKLAYFDRLTSLPNRSMFLEKLEDNIRGHVMKDGGTLVVMSIDLDRFKDVNDTLGHEVGDKVLEAVASRFVHSMSDEDAIISRASADEFNIIVSVGDKYKQDTLTNKIFTALEEPISVYQESFQIGVSIGVSHCPDDGVEASKLLKNSDIALNRAKEEGRNTARYYSEDFDKVVQKRFQMLRDLRTGLEEDQFIMYYQPQFNLRTGELIGSEALLRWFRPDNSKNGGQFISPVDFIPIAEQSGLIVPLGEWVLRTACKANQSWHAQGLNPGRIAVNISGVQFHRSDLNTIVENVLNETGLDPKNLELEVTESIFMDDMEKTINTLNQLHAQGIELAIDDFGTGYSSLSYLRQFPIDRLKVDQSFVRNALSNSDDMAITKTIINLGHSLGLSVIAEGVETFEHENFLKHEGCDEVQGFRYSKAIPENEFLQFIRTYAGDLLPPQKLFEVK